ncbi:hypothetical protein ABID22_000452 [Pontibacter aydingkolensis]
MAEVTGRVKPCQLANTYLVIPSDLYLYLLATKTKPAIFAASMQAYTFGTTR